jgi:hypothetical protein
VAVVGGCLGMVAIVAVGAGAVGGDRLAGATFIALAATAMVPAWLGLGGSLVRLPSVGDHPAEPISPLTTG